MPKKTFSDHELWDGVLIDDPKAFAALYSRYWLRLYKTANFFIKDTDACEEIVHDVFVLVWNKRHTINIERFGSYLNAMARYEVFRHIKAAKLSKIEYTESYLENIEDNTLNLGALKIEESDLENTLINSLKGLPSRCREIFYLSKIQHLTNEEISKKLDISKHTVENQLSQALKHLRNHGKDLFFLAVLADML